MLQGVDLVVLEVNHKNSQDLSDFAVFDKLDMPLHYQDMFRGVCLTTQEFCRFKNIFNQKLQDTFNTHFGDKILAYADLNSFNKHNNKYSYITLETTPNPKTKIIFCFNLYDLTINTAYIDLSHDINRTQAVVNQVYIEKYLNEQIVEILNDFLKDIFAGYLCFRKDNI